MNNVNVKFTNRREALRWLSSELTNEIVSQKTAAMSESQAACDLCEKLSDILGSFMSKLDD